MRFRSTIFVAWLILLAPTPASEARDAPAAPGWDYVVRPTADLEQLTVRLCCRGFVPRRLMLAEGATLGPLRLLTPGRLRAEPTGTSARVVGVPPGGCVEYVVDIDELLAERAPFGDCYRAGRDVVLWPGAWLLRPARWPDDAQITIRFDMPTGWRAATPWPPVTRRPGSPFRLNRYAAIRYGPIALGRFTPFPVQVDGGELDVVLLDGPVRATRLGIERWLTEAARAVSDLYRGFPVPRALVLIRPVAAGGEPVLFGRTTRGGGSCVSLLLSSRATDEELPGEWVAVHEMIHLGMPLLKPTEGWITEGFVQYYNEVLRARAGMLTPQGGWQKLHEGFGRGRRSDTGRTLLAESRDMHANRAYWRVYWAGAALALESDLAIRRGGTRARSLDDVIRFFHRELTPSYRLWDGMELLRRADARLGRPLLVPLAKTALARTSFPPLDASYEALGLRPDGWRVIEREDLPARRVRRVIMSPGGGYPDPSEAGGEALPRPP